MTGLCAFARHGLTLLVLGSAAGAPLSAQQVNRAFLDSVLVRLSSSGDRSYVVAAQTRVCQGHG